MELIDTHCHVSYPDFDQDRDQVLERARQAGVVGLLTVATDPNAWRRYLDLAEGRPSQKVALGFHPNYADTFNALNLRELRVLLEKNRGKAVAIGETGLDFFREYCPGAAQREALQAQLDLAAELDLPFILHCRKAEDELCTLLQGQADRLGKPLRGVWHCFTAQQTHLEQALKLGLHLGFGGVVTYPKAEEVRAAARATPSERLLLETDCPYLTPQPWRGTRNEPAYLCAVLERLARERGVSSGELAQTTTENARRLFGAWRAKE